MNFLQTTVAFACLDSLVELVLAGLILWVSKGVSETIYKISIGIVVISIITWPLALVICCSSPPSKKYWFTLTLLTLFWLGALVSSSVIKSQSYQVNEVQNHYNSSIETYTPFPTFSISRATATGPITIGNVVFENINDPANIHASTLPKTTNKATTPTGKKAGSTPTPTVAQNKRAMPTITIAPRSPSPQGRTIGGARPVGGAAAADEAAANAIKKNMGKTGPKKTQKASVKVGKELADIWWGLIVCATVMVIWCVYLWFHFWKMRKEETEVCEGAENSSTALVGGPVEPKRRNGDYEEVRIQ